jgi:hypothetical protein
MGELANYQYQREELIMKKLDSRQFSQEAYGSLIALKVNLRQLAHDVLQAEVQEKRQRRPNLPDPTEDEIQERAASYYGKSSSLVQGLSSYISVWGLHRLTGDTKKFSLGTAEDTQYKGKVYGLFLERLKVFSQEDFVLWSDSRGSSDEKSLVNLPLRRYTALNHLAMQLAKEWSFWSVSILGEAKE